VRETTLAVVLVLTTVVSAGYYLYVLMVMFMRPRVEGIAVPRATGGLTRGVLVVSVLAILALGVQPDWFVRLTGASQPPTTGYFSGFGPPGYNPFGATDAPGR
jgi:NADH-quinone oxidoreductase subunit N